jgi:hypothetical protein
LIKNLCLHQLFTILKTLKKSRVLKVKKGQQQQKIKSKFGGSRFVLRFQRQIKFPYNLQYSFHIKKENKQSTCIPLMSWLRRSITPLHYAAPLWQTLDKSMSWFIPVWYFDTVSRTRQSCHIFVNITILRFVRVVMWTFRTLFLLRNIPSLRSLALIGPATQARTFHGIGYSIRYNFFRIIYHIPTRCILVYSLIILCMWYFHFGCVVHNDQSSSRVSNGPTSTSTFCFSTCKPIHWRWTCL